MYYIIQSRKRNQYLFSEQVGQLVPALWTWDKLVAKQYLDFDVVHDVAVTYSKQENTIILTMDNGEVIFEQEPITPSA